MQVSLQATLSVSALPALFARTMQMLLQEESPDRLVVACSGGPDSMALALLAHDWAVARNITLSALIVDHGLRVESAREAAQTADWLLRLDIAAQIIPLQLKDGSAIQERARTARYEAMLAWCREHKSAHLLLGHHAQDQIETMLFRLLRGSGIHGLAGMSARSHRQHITILRPLLGVCKESLQAYLCEQAQPWIDDPTNQQTDFARVRLRKCLAHYATPGQQARLWHVAEACARMRRADELAANDWLARHATSDPGGSIIFAANWFDLPHEWATNLLKRALTTVNGGAQPPRQHDAALLADKLMREPDKACTLHGCLIFCYRRSIWIVRELARTEPPIALSSHHTYRWDKRFNVTTYDLPENCTLAALGEAGWHMVKHRISQKLPRRAALALPALWHLEAPVCVPHIDIYAAQPWRNQIQICVDPAKPLAAPAFFLLNNPFD